MKNYFLVLVWTTCTLLMMEDCVAQSTITGKITVAERVFMPVMHHGERLEGT